jgi:ABC-type branched-subunit amino acid transport system substrate-binding protein
VASGATPIRIGVLHDYPQADDLLARAIRLGIDAATANHALDREVELVEYQARGLPAGSEHEMREAFVELERGGVLAIVGPSISDNSSLAATWCDESALPAINYSGGEHTRSEWMFHYQVGSLEEEGPALVDRMEQRGFTRAAVVFDQSPVGRGFVRAFEAAIARRGLDIGASASISALAEDAAAILERLRASEPDVLVYFGLGVASHAVAVARTALGWDVPVLASSALMFGYARPDWRDGYAGWEYLDTVADDNRMRAELRSVDKRIGGGPIGCAGYDIGRILGTALSECEHLTRAGIRDALQRVKRLPATSGHEGTLMGFGVWDRAALKGHFLVLREWRDGRSVQV